MEASKERSRRQLPQTPSGKSKQQTLSGRKVKSTGLLPSSQDVTTSTYHKISVSSISEAGERLTLSPPGTKPRLFTSYTSNSSISGREGEDSCVTVAVRVRPYSDREVRLGAKQVVRMFNNETTITSKDGTSHLFCYDHCFWSFDDSQSHFADQETVYRELAQPLLEKAFEGYNTCLFAYGQTGSGKSYCIMGEQQALGIVPQFANELFDRIEEDTDDQTSFKVEVSYYEIYKERIHDLLASTKQKSSVNLRVREHPVMGPYVEDLSTYVASSYADIEQWLALGNRFRATAATGMNDRSSRSHSVFTILLTQTKVVDDDHHNRVSRINLIDLAGSERSSLANTSGERLKEGASINKSLHTLGKVISLLSERSTGRRKKVYVPYRDSTLTWLLKESLGGNSKTAMIATISPANLHYEESLSTLRYAQQARTIVNIARINEDPSSRLIRELRQEIELLKRQLGLQGGEGDIMDMLRSHEEVKHLREKLKEYEKLMRETTRSWEERLRVTEERKLEEAEELKKAGVSYKVDNKLPNLVNLNDDPQLSEMLLYMLKEGDTTVGRNDHCDIQLGGALVMKDHCIFVNDGKQVVLKCSRDEEAQTFINGTLLTTPTVLHHGDRVIIAGEHFFRFNHPQHGGGVAKGGAKRGEGKGFEFAREEYVKVQTQRLEEERVQERQAMVQEIQAMKMEAERKILQQKQTYEDKLRNLEGTLDSRTSEVSEKEQQKLEAEERITELEMRNKLLEEETMAQRHIIEMERLRTLKEYDEIESQSNRLMMELEDEKRKLEEDIAMLISNQSQLALSGEETKVRDVPEERSPVDLVKGAELLRMATMLQEANVISKNMSRPYTFCREESIENNETVFRVLVTNTRENKVTHWTWESFEARLEQMRELYQLLHFLDADNGEWASFVGDSDPFYDPNDVWVSDSLVMYSPKGRRSSLLAKVTPSRRLSQPDLAHIQKRLHTSMTPFSPSTIYLPPLSNLSSPDQSPQMSPKTTPTSHGITRHCQDKMASLLQYKHKCSGSVGDVILGHLKSLHSIVNDMEEVIEAELGSVSLELYCTTSLLLNTALCLETALHSFNNDDVILCGPIECCHTLIDDITHQTSLYCTKLLQAVLGEDSDVNDAVSNVIDSLQNISYVVGQIAFSLNVSEKFLSKESSINMILSDSQNDYYTYFQDGYQGWCSIYFEKIVYNLNSHLVQVQDCALNSETMMGLASVVESSLKLIYKISTMQDILYQSAYSTYPSSNNVSSLVALVHKTYTSALSLATHDVTNITDLLVANNLVARNCEGLGVSVLSLLRPLSADELSSEIQTIVRDIAKATRSLNHLAKQGSIVAMTTIETPPISIPTHFSSPSPPTSDQSDTSLV